MLLRKLTFRQMVTRNLSPHKTHTLALAHKQNTLERSHFNIYTNKQTKN